jgi:flagellin
LVNRGRELAIQSSNRTLNDLQRQTLNQEFAQIQNEIDRLTGSLEFNGQKLLDDAFAPSADSVNIQAGSGSEAANQINLNVVESVKTETFEITNSDISTSQGALQAVDAFEKAAQTLNAARRQVGAVRNRLASAPNGLNSQIENLTQAESGLADTDFAEEVTRPQQGLLRFETYIRALASQIQNEQCRAGILDFSV